MDIVNFIGGDGGILGTLTTIIFFLFLIYYQKILMLQTVWKAEKDLKVLEEYDKKAEGYIFKKLGKNATKKTKDSVKNFMDFFVSGPVDLDPYGIIGKIEHVMNRSEKRFQYFVDSVAPKATKEEKANIKFGIIGAIGVHQIYKIVRHLIISVKKNNNIQMVMLLQIYLPILSKMAKSQTKATKAFVEGVPIGDAIGPIVAASYMTKKATTPANDIVLTKEKIGKKEVFIMKADGPGSALGKIGVAVEKTVKKEKIDHIITVDAAGKLEGEKTGSIAEGVGVAMGGIGVERSKIEEIAVKLDIPMDGIVIKMSPDEASIPIKKNVFKALDNARAVVEKNLEESTSKKILLIGVGNTCGVGNSKKSLTGLETKLKPIWISQKKEKEEEKKKQSGWF
ncbi:MAG: DUF1512 family protein [Candidatus Aenigmarchaeota archaeon]|nr:DUF1512 family protein [Candidatus Aenigmarchaeota archaeon]